LDAALAVCEKRGLHDATLAEICDAAGYTRGAVYSNFKGRDELLLTVFEERIEPHLRRFVEPMVTAATAREQAEGARGLIETLLSEERRYLQLLVEFWGFAARNQNVAERFAVVRRRRRAAIEDMISERIAARSSGDGPQAAILAAGFVALSIGVLFEALIDEELDAARVEATLFELIARGAARRQR
jgi:AcrR family transcriptional regulator